MLRVLFAALFLILPASCKGSGEASENAPKGTASGGDSSKKPEGPPSVRTKLETYRPLLAESARAELDVGGMLVDFGTADHYKYTRGGWRTGWGENKAEGSVTYTEVTGQTARIEGMARGGAKELVVRARSKAGTQKLSTWVDGIMAGSEEVGTEWKTVRFPVKNVTEAGRRDILLRFRGSGSPLADVDWVWLAGEAGAEPPPVVPRALPVTLSGKPRRSLVAPSARTYTFYLDVPPKASLVFDYGSDKGAKFTVRAHPDAGEPKVLFGPKTAESWTEAEVDLGPLAGKTVALELQTEGPKGSAGWGEPEIMVAPAKKKPKSSAGATAKNAIFILIDTARADSFAPYGGVAFDPDAEVFTPSYDKLAEQSTVFLNAYDNENWTKPSVASYLSSLYPSTHDTKTDGAKLPDEVELVSQELKKDGFHTASLIANGYVSDKFGFNKGWDAYKNYIREGIPTEADHVYGDAIDWLKENKDKGRFFLYIQTIDPHVVYRVPREYSKRYFPDEYNGPLGPTIDADDQRAISSGKLKATDTDIAWLRAMYRSEVTYHDEYMGKFFEQVKKMGLLKDTFVVVTNDHGEELYEHGRLGHGHSLHEELTRAPLLMHFPKIFSPGRQVKEIVEAVDVVPTMLEVLGQKPMKDAEGHSLLPLIQGNPGQRPYYAITEFLDGQRAVRVGDWRLIRTPGNRVELYRSAKERVENTDYIEKGGHDIARRLCEVHLGEGLATPDKKQRLQNITTRRKLKANCADIDPKTRRQLAALGYLGGGDCKEHKGEKK